MFGGEKTEAIAKALRSDGKQTVRISACGDSAAQRGNGKKLVAILPMPLFDAEGKLMVDGFTQQQLIQELRGTALAAAGRVRQDFINQAKYAGIVIRDYSLRDEFAVSNALTTAEAAVGIAMNELKRTIAGSKALIIGYGRIGRMLSHLMDAMGANVTVSARKASDFAWIRAMGLNCAQTYVLSGLDRFDVVFNTVPAPVFGANEIAAVRPDAVLIDLASAPGGMDAASAHSFGKHIIHALALPGKYAPESTARNVCSIVYAMESEDDNG